MDDLKHTGEQLPQISYPKAKSCCLIYSDPRSKMGSARNLELVRELVFHLISYSIQGQQLGPKLPI